MTSLRTLALLTGKAGRLDAAVVGFAIHPLLRDWIGAFALCWNRKADTQLVRAAQLHLLFLSVNCLRLARGRFFLRQLTLRSVGADEP